MTTSVKNSFLPPSLISNLQQVLATRNDAPAHRSHDAAVADSIKPPSSSSSSSSLGSGAGEIVKPVVLVTNADGIESSGLEFLVQALVQDARCQVCVCAPRSDRSVSGHSVTVSETVSVCPAEISGAVAFEVSGTPADCVSLAMSGALFSWAKPALVISGINRGSSSGRNMLCSGAVAAAREALISGVPSLCISLNWKKDVSSESNMKEAVSVCLPLIHAAVKGVQNGVFPNSCLLNIEIPSSPLANKGFKLTRQSVWRSSLSWQAVSAIKHPSAGHFMSSQQSLGIKLAQLSRDASAAGAARRLNSHRKNVEVESVGVAGKPSSQQTVKKYFRLEFLDKDLDNVDEDLDIKAVGNGFVSITPLSVSPTLQPEVETSISNWFAGALTRDH
ncbi:Survival protein SurE-like phosphatase/nucleotidase [Parasponia andersonii]|uniref:Survival protein SurE-like phosphatase/nucleotidase n=1 Tax=Parasponia andersonii TaxID=3476 RepID=A0A2P5BDE0_PARAD|nr:Survival protein SurE-like phosphatase/nucleotidase [Parasponia andersonii]